MPAVKYRLLTGFIIVVIAGLGVIHGFFSEPDKNEDWLPLQPVMLDKIERKYGAAARQRFIDWQQLMVTGKCFRNETSYNRLTIFLITI